MGFSCYFLMWDGIILLCPYVRGGKMLLLLFMLVVIMLLFSYVGYAEGDYPIICLGCDVFLCYLFVWGVVALLILYAGEAYLISSFPT